MHLVSWNVNGIRAAMDKGLRDFVVTENPDVLCLQEVKAQHQQVDLEWAESLGYHIHWNAAEKKGYSGTATFSLIEPLSVESGMNIAQHDKEGRVLTTTFDDFHLVNVYTPNAQGKLARLDYRMQWDIAFLDFVKKLRKKRPVLFCGDLNCAHHEIDLANPGPNRKNAGFSDEERAALDRMQQAKFTDTFRQFNDQPEQYSWWSYRSGARARNVGWRLDYFWASEKILPSVKDAAIRPEILGSDHCPVEIRLG
ncbi:MAG: exodeoxyribonuclease III [Planctomycetota bacterium]